MRAGSGTSLGDQNRGQPPDAHGTALSTDSAVSAGAASAAVAPASTDSAIFHPPDIATPTRRATGRPNGLAVVRRSQRVGLARAPADPGAEKPVRPAGPGRGQGWRLGLGKAKAPGRGSKAVMDIVQRRSTGRSRSSKAVGRPGLAVGEGRRGIVRYLCLGNAPAAAPADGTEAKSVTTEAAPSLAEQKAGEAGELGVKVLEPSVVGKKRKLDGHGDGGEAPRKQPRVGVEQVVRRGPGRPRKVHLAPGPTPELQAPVSKLERKRKGGWGGKRVPRAVAAAQREGQMAAGLEPPGEDTVGRRAKLQKEEERREREKAEAKEKEAAAARVPGWQARPSAVASPGALAEASRVANAVTIVAVRPEEYEVAQDILEKEFDLLPRCVLLHASSAVACLPTPVG